MFMGNLSASQSVELGMVLLAFIALATILDWRDGIL